MKKVGILSLLLLLLAVLTACNRTDYKGISKDEPFIASVNISEPSIDFIRPNGEKIETWDLKEAYTGATLVGEHAILLYGNQLEQADLVNLDTGEIQKKIDVSKGATNAYYDDANKTFYIANSGLNEVTAYNQKGERIQTMKTGKYPMAMLVEDGHLYVVNFKDTFISVFNTTTKKLEKKIPIPKSSHGLDFVDGELWLGGHGAGEKPNTHVLKINPKTSKVVGKMDLPIMPIAFAKLDEREFVLSHGESMLYELNEQQQISWEQEIGSNPFAVEAFQNQIVVAGYDDQTLYWVKDHHIVKKTKVGQAPFQLLVRENVK
ncbi:hypothetical protein D6T70_07745 [Kurthia gibsonii]|uniref:YncE family protein n=1 Tax=Kurthia gibsonii TaxID=33946 RepID=UPI000EAC72F3|nr:hypothetical protein [Kurthia gibsonii]RXH52173.1 hypothetical protein D6T70_07745 [Kurthia gibsonii]